MDPLAQLRAPRPSTARSVVTTAAANLALPLSALATGPILARALGPEGRGELAAVLAPVAFATFLFHIGWAEASTYHSASRRWSPLRLALVGAVLSSIAGTVGALAIWFLAPTLLQNSPGVVPLLRETAWLLPVFVLATVLRGIHQGTGDFSVVNRERWSSVLSRLLLIVSVAALGGLTVTSAAWITNLTSAVVVAVLLHPLWRRWRERARPSARGRELPWADVLSYGSRAWIGSVSVLIMLRLDTVLITPLTAAEQLGFYAVAVAVAEVPAFGFGALREVVFARSSSRGDPGMVARAGRLCVLVMLPAVLVVLPVVPWGVSWAFGADFGPAGPMAQVLLVAAVPAGLATIAGAGLMSLGRPGVLSAWQIGVAVVNIGLVLLLVPSRGGMGAALASLITYVLLGVVTMSLFVRAAGVRWRDLLVPRREDVAFVIGLVKR